MRVLWITSIPTITINSKSNKIVGGGWMSSLETELVKRSDIHLGIAFKSNQENAFPFIVEKTTYFPISFKSAKNKFIKLLHRWKHNIEPESLLKKYINVIDEFKPDIIQIFGTEFNYGLIISKTTIPCIIHFQGNLIVYHHKWFSGLTAFEILKYSKKRILIQGYGHFHEYFYFKKAVKREYKIFKDCQYFMGRTDWDRRITSVLAPNSVYYHCDEMLRPEFDIHTWGSNFPRTDLVILTTIRNCTYKGLETIFECKKILQQCYFEKEITWKIAGITEADEISYLIERKYNDSFIDNNIHLIGSLDEKKLCEVMLDADFFVHPSHIDNSPNTVCEAMILGMPIIATYAGGIPSLLENKKEGLLVQDGDPFALAGAIIELIRDSNYASVLGKNAQVRAKIRHNPALITQNVIDIYTEVLAIKNAENIQILNEVFN